MVNFEVFVSLLPADTCIITVVYIITVYSIPDISLKHIACYYIVPNLSYMYMYYVKRSYQYFITMHGLFQDFAQEGANTLW